MDVVVRFLANFVIRLKSLFFLPLISKNLGADQYGIWTQITITMGLLLPAFMLRLETASVRYLSSEDSGQRSRDFFSMVLLIWTVITPLLLVSYLFKERLSSFLFGTTELPGNYILLFLFLVMVRTSFHFVRNYYRTSSQVTKYSLIQVLASFTSLGLSAFFVLRGGDIAKVIIAFIFVEAFMTLTIIADIIKLIGLPGRISFYKLIPYLKYSLPLIPNAVLYWVINYSDRFVITHLLGISEVGIYSASYSLGKMATFFLAPISFVLFPKISRMWEEDKKEKVRNYMQDSITYFLMLALPSVLGIYYLAPYLLEVLATTTFITSRFLILLITSGFLLVGVYQIYLYVIHLSECTRYLPLMFFGIASLNLSLNFLLVPRIGLMGAATATLVSYLLQAVIVTIWALKLFPINLKLQKIIKSIVSALAMYGVLCFFKPDGLVSVSLVVLLGGVVYLFTLIVTRTVGKKEWRLVKMIFAL